MAVGDDAIRKGFPLVNEDDMVRFGAREINVTRDLVALTRDLIETVWPLSKGGTGASGKAAARSNLGITSGVAAPSGGADGDIYLQILG